jgi:hypothetical protein
LSTKVYKVFGLLAKRIVNQIITRKENYKLENPLVASIALPSGSEAKQAALKISERYFKKGLLLRIRRKQPSGSVKL